MIEIDHNAPREVEAIHTILQSAGFALLGLLAGDAIWVNTRALARSKGLWVPGRYKGSGRLSEGSTRHLLVKAGMPVPPNVLSAYRERDRSGATTGFASYVERVASMPPFMPVGRGQQRSEEGDARLPDDEYLGSSSSGGGGGGGGGGSISSSGSKLECERACEHFITQLVAGGAPSNYCDLSCTRPPATPSASRASSPNERIARQQKLLGGALRFTERRDDGLSIDAFIVNDELDVLEWRLSEHDSFTTLFIGIEANKTHMGTPKPTHVRNHWERFRRWHHKFLLVTLEEPPTPPKHVLSRSEKVALEREGRNAALKVVQRMTADRRLPRTAVVSLVSDVDEVYEREAARAAIRKLSGAGEAGLRFVRPQTQFAYYDLRCQNELLWPGPQLRTFFTLAETAASISHFALQQPVLARTSDLGRRPFAYVDAGLIGWHLSNAGGADRIRSKYRSVWESGGTVPVKDLEGAIRDCKDVLGRKRETWGRAEPWKLPSVLTGAATNSSLRPVSQWHDLLLQGVALPLLAQ